MPKQWLLLIALVALPRTPFFAEDLPVIQGTINVVVANRNGFVVLTDSRQSVKVGSRYVPLLEPAQKLFKLDELTVCTIAGFGAAGLPTFPEFASDSAAVLQDFRRELSRKPVPSFGAKLWALSFVFERLLEVVANVPNVPAGEDQYHFELILAGYEPNGVAKIGYFALDLSVGVSPTGAPYFQVQPPDVREMTVGDELVWRIGGQRTVADEILSAPWRYAQDQAIREYSAAYALDRGRSLTLEQLRSLASSLARHTAMRSETVGGDDQIAILENQRVASVLQASFPERPPVAHFPLFVGVGLKGFGEAIHGSGALVIKGTFDQTAQLLDGNFFYGNYFVDTHIMYDGGSARFDSTNQVKDCVLVLGDHANNNQLLVRHLLDDFGWKRVIRFEPRP